MPRARPFHDMTIAPRDGTTTEVRHGPRQEIVLAYRLGLQG